METSGGDVKLSRRLGLCDLFGGRSVLNRRVPFRTFLSVLFVDVCFYKNKPSSVFSILIMKDPTERRNWERDK